MSWSFDADGRPATRSVNGGSTVAFAYDDDGLLVQAGALSLSREPATGAESTSALGSVTTAKTYNPFGELETDAAAFGGISLYSNTYTRDKVGRITRKVETIEGVTTTFDYGYDLAGRLETVHRNATLEATYVYDANGNRLSKTTPTGVETGTYDAQDRLMSYGDIAYTYTANGELRAKIDPSGTTAYDYDEIGNLVRVALPERVIEYVIDAANRRVGKRVDGALVMGLLYDDQLRPAAELNGNGGIVSRFVYGTRANVPEYIVKGGQTYRVVSDHGGSVRLVVNAATGAVAQRIDYDEFGSVTNDTNPGFQPFGFAGGLFETDTRLTRLGARDYDPVVGRWTTKDAIRFDGRDSNLYGHVLNDPINLGDPSGLFPGEQAITYAFGFAGAGVDFGNAYIDQLMATYWDGHDYFSDDPTFGWAGQDRYFHCRANCRAAQRGAGGVDAAEWLSDARESFDSWSGDSADECAADQAVNAFGRAAGAGNPGESCRDLCSHYRPGGTFPARF